MTRKITLEKEIKANPTPKKILDLLQLESFEYTDRLKAIKEEESFRFIQGQLNILDRYIELLKKVTS